MAPYLFSVARKDEQTFSSWTAPASDAEESRYEWTKNKIREALCDPALEDRGFIVYAKGSYPNHTNVVRDSDVDIAVELTELIYNDFSQAPGLSLPALGLSPYRGDYSFGRFKDEVEAALVRAFGRSAVKRGNKAIRVRESSRNLAADVVACQTLRWRYPSGNYTEGIVIWPDRGGRIANYPRQHLDAGVAKNDRCSRRYKRVVRILKRLENEMVERRVIDPVPSFLIESLVWNCPDSVFLSPPTWTDRVFHALATIYRYTSSTEPGQGRWLEANGVKFLFNSHQRWSRDQGTHFAERALTYLGMA